MSNLTFRRVTHGDYDDVIAIRRGIYFGMDYLVSRYHAMLDTHDGYVALHGDKMVAFELVSLIDDGTTFLTRAARVHENYEGKGVYRKLSDYIHQIYSTNKSILRYANALHVDADADRLISKGAELIGRREARTFQGRTAYIVSRLEQARVDDVRPSSRDEILQIFKSDRLFPTLFTSQRITADWVAYRLMESNLKYLQGDVLATSADPDNLSDTPLLSVGTPVRCEAGFRLCVDFHGDVGDGSKVQEHLVSHIKNCIDKEDGEFFLMISFEDKMDDKLLHKVIDELSFKEKFRVHMNLLEQAF